MDSREQGSSADATGAAEGPSGLFETKAAAPDPVDAGDRIARLARVKVPHGGKDLFFFDQEDADRFLAAAESFSLASLAIAREVPAPPRRVYINDRHWPRVTITPSPRPTDERREEGEQAGEGQGAAEAPGAVQEGRIRHRGARPRLRAPRSPRRAERPHVGEARQEDRRRRLFDTYQDESSFTIPKDAAKNFSHGQRVKVRVHPAHGGEEEVSWTLAVSREYLERALSQARSRQAVSRPGRAGLRT
jgi:hypothetical protein